MQKHPEQYVPDPTKSDAPGTSPSEISSAHRLNFKRFRPRSLFLAGLAALTVLIVALLYQAMGKDAAQALTQRDIDAAVARSLARATPQPSIASQAYEVIRPSVVRVSVTLPSSSREPDSGGIGAGVVIDSDGIVLTNLHVVQGATSIQLTYADGTQSRAAIIASDPGNDLAVLQAEIIPDDMVPATLTSSATLNVGDEVVAVGNPFGLPTSVTSGVVSGLGRVYTPPEGGDTLDNLIQFDAAVNPGNSGGPLVNRNGEVVGIVTGLVNPTSARVFVGLGFAVPIEAAAAAAGPPWY